MNGEYSSVSFLFYCNLSEKFVIGRFYGWHCQNRPACRLWIPKYAEKLPVAGFLCKKFIQERWKNT
ncbi:hypothetical protein D3Z53_24740 [Lachnospiraceae bacterium]|nr:hypothetical protein [Lachnospiraceae bacterium]